MPQVLRTANFAKWLRDLRDRRAAARVERRIDRLAAGNAGDVEPVGEGLSEMGIDYGPGYRVYFGRRGEQLVVVLSGSDKRQQSKAIAEARGIWRQWKEENDGSN